VVEQAADDGDGSAELVGELREAGVLLAARLEVALQVAEPEGVGAVAEAALPAVDDGKAAVDGEPRG